MRTVKDLKIGESSYVIKLHTDGVLKQRLMDMGITPGAKVIVRKFAPLGDPMELNIRGYELSIRKKDASIIEIQEDIRWEK